MKDYHIYLSKGLENTQMNEFENKLIIKDSSYKNGFFPMIPNFRKRGSAFILTNGYMDDIVVNEHTTTKQIRQGKYTRLVEIATLPYIKEITFNSSSKEAAYSFDVYVKAVIQVSDPIRFYENKNLDIEAYFDNLLSLDVRKITRRYSILDFDCMDAELTEKLAAYNNFDESKGFNYQISAVAATPGKDAERYVHKHSTQQLDIELKNSARKLSASIAKSYEEAIRTAIVEGAMTEVEGLLKIKEYENTNFDDQITRLQELRDKGIITDTELRSMVRPELEKVGNKTDQTMMHSQVENHGEINDSILDGFYEEEE